jgi:hypothetical protein
MASQSVSIRKIDDSDFPNLFQASDKASKNAQSNYLTIVATDLFFMTFAAALAVYNYNSEVAKESVYIISGIFLLLGLMLTIVMKTMGYEDLWYQGRALAESTKTLTWRFMTCSESFESKLSEQVAKDVFIKKIKELGDKFTELNKNLNAKLLSLPVTSQQMFDVRKLDLNGRKKYYIENRIQNQKDWYANKAEFNSRRYNFWFIIILISQVLGLISITYLIVNPGSAWNFVGLFTTLASAALSWLQLKQHQELKQAYTTATQELSYIEELSFNITTEETFSEFVLDSENAISREHTLWLAQRRK